MSEDNIKLDNKDKEMEKLGVECKCNHTQLETEMEKTGTGVCRCQYCGQQIKKKKKE